MIIEVTKDHINRGRRSCTECPVALAILDATKKRYIFVQYNSIIVGGYIFTPPYKATEFMRRFDTFLPVDPFEFELDMEAK